MNGEHHESGEGDSRDDPGNESRALDELSREEILRALAGLNERLKADADDAYSLLARGMLHSRLGDDRRAAADFTRVIELEPDNAEALENRAAARSDLGKHRLAREDYDALIRLEPDNAVALYSRGRLRRQAGRPGRGRGRLRPGYRPGAGRGGPILPPGVHSTLRWATCGGRWRTSTRPSPLTPETPPSTTTGALPTGDWASSGRPSATLTPRYGWNR